MRRILGLAGFALNLVGLGFLWRQVTNLPPVPEDPSGLPDYRILIGCTLAGFCLLILLIVTFTNRRAYYPYDRDPVNELTVGYHLRELPWIVIGLAGVGLLGALSPYYGIVALASLVLSIGSARQEYVSGRTSAVAKVFAGGQLLFIGVMYLMAQREVGSPAVADGGEVTVGAVLTLLGPGVRMIAGGLFRHREWE